MFDRADQIDLMDEGTTFGDRFESSVLIQAAEIPGIKNAQTAMFQGRSTDAVYMDNRPAWTPGNFGALRGAPPISAYPSRDKLNIQSLASRQAQRVMEKNSRPSRSESRRSSRRASTGSLPSGLRPASRGEFGGPFNLT